MLDGGIAPFAKAVYYLFIGQDGRTGGAPVYRRLLLIGQPPLIEFEEYPLGPLVILRVTGGHLPVPVVTCTPVEELILHGRYISIGKVSRVAALLYGGILCRQPKGVPPHRGKDVVALHELIAYHHVPEDIVPCVTHVECPRRIREHHQAVELLFGRVLLYFKEPPAVPVLLPFRLNLPELVLIIFQRLLSDD